MAPQTFSMVEGLYIAYQIMGKFRGRNFRRKGGELNFEGFIFVHMPTTRNFHRMH